MSDVTAGRSAGPKGDPTGADLLQRYRPDLAEALDRAEEPAFRAKQVLEHLMRRPLVPFGEASSLPTALRQALDPQGVSTLTLVEQRDDGEGTSRLLFRTADGLFFESVLMRYPKRVTLCVSSQVGCPLGCRFCATGTLGFRRDLATGEIVDQAREVLALLARDSETASTGQTLTPASHLSNVVFMGMGEPLLNVDAVLDALLLLRHPEGLGLAQRSLSVSTVGIPAGIRRMAKAAPQVHLALSLHAPDDALRSSLMPVAKRHRLHDVLAAADDHFAATHRKLFVEYVLLGGVNDRPAQAHALADLLRGRVATVNLIPWNEGPGGFRCSSPAAARAFREVLEKRGVEVSVRRSKGAESHAACGQLAATGIPPDRKRSDKGKRAGRDERSQKGGDPRGY